MCDMIIKIKPCKSRSIPAIGLSNSGATIGNRTVQVQEDVIEESFEQSLAGNKADQFEVILFKYTITELREKRLASKLKDMIGSIRGIFSVCSLLRNYVVKLYVDHNIKPVVELPRCLAYHLKSRIDEVVSDIMAHDVIEEHPKGEHAPWV